MAIIIFGWETAPFVHTTVRKPAVRPGQRITDPTGKASGLFLGHQLHAIRTTISHTNPLFPVRIIRTDRNAVFIFYQIIHPLEISFHGKIILPV